MTDLIWSSVPLMTAIDVSVAVVALVVGAALWRQWRDFRVLRMSRAAALLYACLLLTAVFYLGDLLAMYVLPSFVGHEAAMRSMRDMHLNWSWIVTLVGVGALGIGLLLMARVLVPRTAAALADASAARDALAQANAVLEQRVAERTAALDEDIRRREAVEGALRESEARYRDLFDASPIALWEEDWSRVKALVDRWCDESGSNLESHLDAHPERLQEACAAIRIVDVNAATLKLYGAHEKAAFLAAVHRRLRAGSFEGFRERLLGFTAGERRMVSEFEETRGDGTRVVVRATLEIVEAHRQDWARVFSAMEDITGFRSLSTRLSYQASHDALTGLVNRREFDRQLQRLLESARIDGAVHALAYMDLDQFKVVNDSCGHVAGDELLRQVSGLLQARVRRADTVARLGGDEFGVLMENCPLEQAQRLAASILEGLGEMRFAWEGRTFVVGISIGLVPIGPESGGGGEVLSAADAACFTAKDLGRNRAHVYREGDVELLSRRAEMRWITRINDALESGRLWLARQPIVPVGRRDDAGLHHELLLRMQGEDGETVAPGAFLPAAERYGLCSRLDRWVVEHALGWYASQPVALGHLSLCSLNVSGQSLGDPDFLHFVRNALEASPMPGEKLCFEITETAAIANLTGAVRFMSELRDRGVRFALDDFGSGLSSFGYLKTLPVDFLKIDGVFVRDIADDPVDRAMVDSINQIGHVMGKRTIAEFVESDAVLRVLAELGVDFAQGYAIGRPAPLVAPDALSGVG